MYVFHISGLVRSQCAGHLLKVIQECDADARVEVQSDTGRLFVESKTAVEKLRRALKDGGYETHSVEERP